MKIVCYQIKILLNILSNLLFSIKLKEEYSHFKLEKI